MTKENFERDLEYEDWCAQYYGPVTDDEIEAMAKAGGFEDEQPKVAVANDTEPKIEQAAPRKRKAA